MQLWLIRMLLPEMYHVFGIKLRSWTTMDVIFDNFRGFWAYLVTDSFIPANWFVHDRNLMPYFRVLSGMFPYSNRIGRLHFKWQCCIFSDYQPSNRIIEQEPAICHDKATAVKNYYGLLTTLLWAITKCKRMSCIQMKIPWLIH